MEITEREWHEEMASRMRVIEKSVKTGEHTLVEYRWETGMRLNAVYGSDHIPFLDMEEITKIYDVTSPVINQARRFAGRAGSRQMALTLADEYGNWTGLVRGFLAGLSVKDTRKAVAAHNDSQRANHRSRRHLANVADRLRDDLIDAGGLTLDEAADAIRLYLANARWQDVKGTWDRRHDLRAWREMAG